MYTLVHTDNMNLEVILKESEGPPSTEKTTKALGTSVGRGIVSMGVLGGSSASQINS